MDIFGPIDGGGGKKLIKMKLVICEIQSKETISSESSGTLSEVDYL